MPTHFHFRGVPLVFTRFRDIGRFVFNPETGEILFEAGPKDAGLGDSTPLLCEALA